MDLVLRAFKGVESFMAMFAVLCLFAMTGIVVTDVFLRYVFNSPFLWTHDFIGLYLVSTSFAFVLSATFSNHGHMGVDLLVRRLSRPIRRVLELISNTLAIVFFGLITFVMFRRALESFENKEVLGGIIPWPTWPPALILCLGAGLLVVRLVVRLLELALDENAVHDISGHDEEAF